MKAHAIHTWRSTYILLLLQVLTILTRLGVVQGTKHHFEVRESHFHQLLSTNPPGAPFPRLDSGTTSDDLIQHDLLLF